MLQIKLKGILNLIKIEALAMNRLKITFTKYKFVTK